MFKLLAAFSCVFALASTSALADETAASDKGKANGLPTAKDKQRAVDAVTTRANAFRSTVSDSLGSRGPAATAKSWEEMTPQEQDAARKRWLLNSGDFGPPTGSPRETLNRTRTPKGPYILAPPIRPDEKNPAK